MTKRVYVANKGSHDFSDATRYGELVFLTEGTLSKFNTSQMYRMCSQGLRDSRPGDYILLTSLTTLCSVACSIFVMMHHKLNLLIYKDGAYVERNISFEDLPIYTP